VAVTRDLFGALDSALLLVESDAIEPIVADESIMAVPREQSFSAEAIRHHHGLVVPDILADERYRDRPDVTGPPHLRAYAGHRVESPEGHPVAVLAMAFDRTRDFSPADLALLRALAHRIGELLFGRQ
jgi:GAF domain-containing protein